MILSNQTDPAVLVGKTISEIHGDTLIFTDGSKLKISIGKKVVDARRFGYSIPWPKFEYDESNSPWHVNFAQIMR